MTTLDSIPCQLQSLSKAFGSNAVLRGIDMTLYGGKVTVLMGANGAGKSTLVNVLSGVHKADHGLMTLFGRTYSPQSPSDAIQQGVVTVHQSINDAVLPHLDVATNLALDQLSQSRAGFFINRRKMRDNARKIAASMKLDVDVTAPVHTLGLADKQMIAIARAMAEKPKILILDEPTSSLSSNEAGRLFDLIDRLKTTGVAILYISHRMSDIRRIADRIVALRDGQVSGTFDSTTLDYRAAVKAMLGHDMTDIKIDPAKPGRTTLALRGLTIKPQAEPLHLSVAENEVVAI
ncbi:MAG: ATP-binding cassette domain-containing protein, partial [Granulosicoccus sp.]